MSSLLQGIRVLDFGRYIAGPYVGTLLAEYGADVIRIEKRDGSEDRFPAPVGGGVGALFLQMNRNKRSITLDPASPEGREIVARLVKTADVVIANLPGPTLLSMGLDYDTLCKYKENIIFVTNTAFGPMGPMSKNVGFDGIGQVMSGAVYMTGEPDQPYRAAAAWVDFGTALHCAFGTMAAIMERQKTGKGQIVQGALLATAVTVNNAALIEQGVTGINRVPTGNRGQTTAPVNLYKTKDNRWVLVQVLGQPLYTRWAKLMGEPHWLTDPRFADDDLRGRHGEIIGERMIRWCAEHTAEEVARILGEAKIPTGPVLKPQETLDHPQVQALGILQDTDYPGLPKPAPVAAIPIWMSQTKPVKRRRPPTLGEHTEEVLGELDYGAADIAALRTRNVI